ALTTGPYLGPQINGGTRRRATDRSTAGMNESEVGHAVLGSRIPDHRARRGVVRLLRRRRGRVEHRVDPVRGVPRALCDLADPQLYPPGGVAPAKRPRRPVTPCVTGRPHVTQPDAAVLAPRCRRKNRPAAIRITTPERRFPPAALG